jgi:hypothetical protein
VSCHPNPPEQSGLPAGGWGQWEATYTPDTPDVAVAENVVLQLAGGSSISWHLPSFPGADFLGGSGFLLIK